MRIHAPVKGIFFDIGWTLLRPANDWFINNKMIEYVGRDALALIPSDKKAAALNRALKYLDDNHLVLSEEEELKQFETFYSMLADDLTLTLTREQISEVAHSKVYGMDNYIFFDDTLTTLEALHGKYRLGVISDTWPSVDRMLRYGGIERFFETKTYSCFLGTWKPDKRMYLHALKEMGLPPEQTVFIDDGEENLEGAAMCGIQPIHIIAKPDEKSSGKYPCINKLSELLNILPTA